MRGVKPPNCPTTNGQGATNRHGEAYHMNGLEGGESEGGIRDSTDAQTISLSEVLPLSLFLFLSDFLSTFLLSRRRTAF